MNKILLAFMLAMLLGGFLLTVWQDESYHHLFPLIAVGIAGIGIVYYFYLVEFIEEQE